MKKIFLFIVVVVGCSAIVAPIIYLTHPQLHLRSGGEGMTKLLPDSDPVWDYRLDQQVNHVNDEIKQRQLLLPVNQQQIYQVPNVWSDFFSNKKITYSDQEIDQSLKKQMLNLPEYPLRKNTFFISQNHQFLGKYEGKKVDPDNITIHGIDYRANLAIEMKENDYLGFGFKSNNNFNFINHFVEQYNYDDTSLLFNSPLNNVAMHGDNFISSLHFTIVSINGHDRIFSLPHFSQNNHFDKLHWTKSKIKGYFQSIWGVKYQTYMEQLKKITTDQNSVFNNGGGAFLQYLMPLGYWELIPVSHNVVIMETHSDLTPFAQTSGQILYGLDLNLSKNSDLKYQIIGPFSIINSHDEGNRIAEEKAWIKHWKPDTLGPLIGYYSRQTIILPNRNRGQH